MGSKLTQLANSPQGQSPFSTPPSKPTPATDPMALPAPILQAIEQLISQGFSDKDTFTRTAITPHPVFTGDFTDADFPPGTGSLIRYWSTADIKSQVEWEKYEWKRIRDLFPGKTVAVFNDIDPGDILQGALADSYFLAAVSALAERPERITRLFITSEIQDNGYYRLSLFNLGIWTEFYIDDYLPAVKTSDDAYRLAFSGPREENGVVEVWTALLEKAWAKKYGSYYDIQWGRSSEVLTDLTGAPCQTVYTNSLIIWERLAAADTANFVMLAATSPNTPQDQLSGLLPNHCYAILAVKSVGSYKLLKLRNPWGHYEWKGNWSDESLLWTNEARRIMGMEKYGDEGIFCMSIEDFQRYFESVTLCYVHDQFWSFNLPMDQTKEEEFSAIEMCIEKPTLLYFMVCQIDERRFGGVEGGYQYAPVRMILSKLNGTALEYMDGKASMYSRDAWMRAELAPGTYIWYVEMGWRSNLTALFGVSVYCENQITLKDVTADYPHYLRLCYSESFISSHTPNITFTLDSVTFYSYRLTGEKENGDQREGLYVDVYYAKDESASVVIKHKPWENMRLCKPYHNNIMGNFELEIPENSYQIVVKKPRNALAPHSFKVLLKQRLTE